MVNEWRNVLHYFCTMLILLLYVYSKILSYKVFKLEFSYCEFTSPHISVHNSKSSQIFVTFNTT